MGREVRRVPKGWEHPKEERYGKEWFKPLIDNDFPTAAKEWWDSAVAWRNGTHHDLRVKPELREKYPYFWQWHGNPPDEEYHRPAWTDDERTCFQVYENVSEGTPVSPVFETKEALIGWLVKDQGMTQEGAAAFAEGGYCPSMIISGGNLYSGFQAAELLAKQREGGAS
jgi:hypothetical protein